MSLEMVTFGDMEKAGRAIIMLGSNLGDRGRNLTEATTHLENELGDILAESSLYETVAWGMEAGTPDFLNQAVCLGTDLAPEALMMGLLGIERDMGRKRGAGTESRVIDLDLILYEDQVITSELLTLPHPRFHLRRFNLLPINEIASDWSHPLLEITISELLRHCADPTKVERFSEQRQ